MGNFCKAITPLFNPLTREFFFKISLKKENSFFKIRFVIHVLKNACWLLVCVILWAFTTHEKKAYEISFLLV